MRGYWLECPEDYPERPLESEEISSIQRQEISHQREDAGGVSSMHKPFPTSEDVRRRMLLPFHKQKHEYTDLSPHTQTEWRSTIFYMSA